MVWFYTVIKNSNQNEIEKNRDEDSEFSWFSRWSDLQWSIDILFGCGILIFSSEARTEFSSFLFLVKSLEFLLNKQ